MLKSTIRKRSARITHNAKMNSEDLNKFYDELQRQGKNNVEDLIHWLKEAQILESIHKTEHEAEKLFRDVDDKNKVTKKQFEQVMLELQKESSIVAEELNRMLLKESNKFIQAVQAAAKAFEDTMDKKEEPPPCCVS